jgi:hypothetical protein
VEKKDPPPRDENAKPVGWRYKSPKDHYGEFPKSPWDTKDITKEDVQETLKGDWAMSTQEDKIEYMDELPEGIDLEKEGLDPEKDIPDTWDEMDRNEKIKINKRLREEEDMKKEMESWKEERDYPGEIDEDTGLEKIQIGGKVFMEVEEPPDIKITRNTLNDNIIEPDLKLLNTEIDEEITDNEEKEKIKKIIN